MSAQRAGFNQYASTIQILDDSDNRDAASVGVALEGLTDRTAFLRGLQDSAIAQNWTRHTISFSDATYLVPWTNGVGTEGYAIWFYGDPNWMVCLDDGQTQTLTGNGIDVGARGQAPGVANMIAVEHVTGPHTSAGLKVEISGDGGQNWAAGDDVPVNMAVYHVEWANVSTASGAWVLAAKATADDHPWVHLYDMGGNLLSSTELDTFSLADLNFSAIGVGGASSNHVILAEDGQGWISTANAGAAPSWTQFTAPWPTGVRIGWSAESGWVAVWQGATKGQFYWSTSSNGTTWSAATLESLGYTDTTYGDVIPGSTAAGGNGSGQSGVPVFQVLRGLWAIVTWDSDTPKVGIRITYSTDQGDTWHHHGVHAPSLTGPPSLAKNASGLGFCVENNYWVSLKAGDPRFGG